MYSTSSGPIAAGHDGRHRLGDPIDRLERGQEGGLVLGTGMQPQGGPGDQGEGALRADDQLGQVVAAGRLHELPPGGDDLAGAQHRLDAQYVVAGDAVLDGPHPPGIGGHVAADAGRLLAGEDRIDQSGRDQRLVEFGRA